MQSEQRLDLVPITKGESGPLDYSLNRESMIQLAEAHGEEIVRDLFTDSQMQLTYTCGEDGSVRAWKLSGEEGLDVEEETGPAKKSKGKILAEKRRDKKEKKKRSEDKAKARFKPY